MKVITVNNVVKQYFEKAKVKNSTYSLRTFAKKLGISKSFASDLLNEKCGVSKDIAIRILENLNIEKDVSNRILANYGKSRIKKSLSLKLKTDEFKLISEWYHYAILALIDIKNDKYTAKRISELLNITENEAKNAVERLLRLRILELDEKLALKETSNVYTTSDDIADDGVKKGLLSNFAKAKDSLLNDDVKIRDFTSVTFAGSKNQLEEAKILTRKFQDDLINLFSKNKNSLDEVYNLSIQLFPLTSKQKNIKEQNI